MAKYTEIRRGKYKDGNGAVHEWILEIDMNAPANKMRHAIEAAHSSRRGYKEFAGGCVRISSTQPRIKQRRKPCSECGATYWQCDHDRKRIEEAQRKSSGSNGCDTEPPAQ